MYTKKLVTMFAIALFAVLSATSEINAQTLKIGSVVNLENQYPNGGYLDTQGYVKDNPAFSSLAASETAFVFTNPSADRDKGSGSWEIISATGKKNGETLKVGDKIHLKNMYPGAGYLDASGFLKDMPMYSAFVKSGQMFAVFTTQSNDRDSGSGTWIVGSGTKSAGSPIQQGDVISLKNGFNRNIGGTKYTGGYLDTQGRAMDVKPVNFAKGLLVFLNSTTTNRDKNSGMWKITAVMSADAEDHISSFKFVGNTLESGESLKQGEGIISVKNKYAAVLQRDGNFCLYKLDIKAENGKQFVKCTMTVGNRDKQGAILTMQTDGNLVLYNAKNEPLWSTDTYRGGPEKLGGRLEVFDEGLLGVLNKSNPEKAIWEFETGRFY